MAIHILQLEKHRFVCGMFWQSLSRPRELTREARELGRKIESDLMVLRTDESTAQAGFAHSAEGARRGMYSLGAIVSKTLAIEGVYYDGEKQRPHNWLAALKLPDGLWAYFAVRDANFLPNGDFAGTKEQVIERLLHDYGLGGWNVVIGDAELTEYSFHNFEVRTLKELIPHRSNGRIRTHRWWGLQPLSRRRPRWPWLAAVALAVAIGAGLYWQHLQRERALQEQQQEAALAEVRRTMQAGAVLQAPPWGARPLPLGTARACAERLEHLAPGGWRLESYVCTGDQVLYNWSRQSSTLAMLQAEIPQAQFDLSGEKASYAQSLSLPRPKPEALLERKALMEPIIARLQLMGIPLTLALLPPPAPPAGAAQSGNTAPPPPAWHSYAFKVEAGGLAPATVAAVLEQPGVRIEQVIYRSDRWSMEGVMYVK